MSDTAKQLEFDEQATCDVCGRYGAYLFDGKTLCADCYETSGSCCPEFGREMTAEDASSGRDSAPHTNHSKS